MNLLITGKTGQLGQSIATIAHKSPHSLTFVGRDAMDFADLDSIDRYFAAHQPFDVIINCAAFTAVDLAENSPDIANQINHLAAARLAKLAKLQHAKFIHISTDYIFDGCRNSAYFEHDLPAPLNVYGATKLAAEQALVQILPTDAIILRVGWLYSEFGHNFVKTMLKLGKERPKLSIVDDQIGTPTYARDLAEAILQIIEHSHFKTRRPTEIYHYANAGQCSWFEFANAIFALNDIKCNISPIASKNYPTPAKRPRKTVLNTAKISAIFDLHPRPWRTALASCLIQLN